MGKRYTLGEEIANSASHSIGVILGIVAGCMLMGKAIESGDAWAIGSVPLYLFGMISSYITSTWYHASRDGKQKELLRKFDHGAIYLHIAGTYSPITLIVLRDVGYWGWGLFIFVWLCAIAGFLLSFLKLKEHSNLETICFIAMGSCILVAFKPLADALAPLDELSCIYWVIGGGASYVIGALFYSLRKVKYMHFVFHLFCLGGSICHAIAIYTIL